MRNLLTAALAAIILLALPITAGAIDFNGTIGRNYVDNPGGDAIGQTAFDTQAVVDVTDVGQLWGNLYLSFESELKGVGFNEEESVPFDFNAMPSGWLNWADLLPGLTVGAGYIHESNGESGEASRSWNRYALKVDYVAEYGPLYLEARGMGWNIADVEAETTDFIYDLRALGETEWGFEGNVFAKLGNDAILTGDWRDNYGKITLGFNPTDGDNTIWPGITLASVDGQTLGSNAKHEKFVALSLTVH